MQTKIAAGEFKAKCLNLLDEVAATRKTLVITKHGKPVAQLVPMPPAGATRSGSMRAAEPVQGDIISPLENEWEALK